MLITEKWFSNVMRKLGITKCEIFEIFEIESFIIKNYLPIDIDFINKDDIKDRELIVLHKTQKIIRNSMKLIEDDELFIKDNVKLLFYKNTYPIIDGKNKNDFLDLYQDFLQCNNKKDLFMTAKRIICERYLDFITNIKIALLAMNLLNEIFKFMEINNLVTNIKYGDLDNFSLYHHSMKNIADVLRLSDESSFVLNQIPEFEFYDLSNAEDIFDGFIDFIDYHKNVINVNYKPYILHSKLIYYLYKDYKDKDIFIIYIRLFLLQAIAINKCDDISYLNISLLINIIKMIYNKGLSVLYEMPYSIVFDDYCLESIYERYLGDHVCIKISELDIVNDIVIDSRDKDDLSDNDDDEGTDTEYTESDISSEMTDIDDSDNELDVDNNYNTYKNKNVVVNIDCESKDVFFKKPIDKNYELITDYTRLFHNIYLYLIDDSIDALDFNRIETVSETFFNIISMAKKFYLRYQIEEREINYMIDFIMEKNKEQIINNKKLGYKTVILNSNYELKEMVCRVTTILLNKDTTQIINEKLINDEIKITIDTYYKHINY